MHYLARSLDFTFETVLSTDRNLDLLRRAKLAGYRIAAIDVNIQRVQARTAAGGHDVPAEKIVARYHRSLDNIAELVRIAVETYIVDNSDDVPVVICEIGRQSASVYPNARWTREAILNLLKKGNR